MEFNYNILTNQSSNKLKGVGPLIADYIVNCILNPASIIENTNLNLAFYYEHRERQYGLSWSQWFKLSYLQHNIEHYIAYSGTLLHRNVPFFYHFYHKRTKAKKTVPNHIFIYFLCKKTKPLSKGFILPLSTLYR
jgi:hypothetical protein